MTLTNTNGYGKLPPEARFSHCFWVSEFTSTAGLDTLIKRIKEGSKTLKEIEEFVKQRSKCEDDYAKSLTKLSKHSIGSVELGSMNNALLAMKNNVDKVASIHQDMASHLADHAQALHSMGEMYNSQRKQAEEAVKKQHNQKKDLYQKNMASKQTYQRKCNAHDQATKDFTQEKANSLKGQKEVDRLEAKMDKCKEEKLKADDAYKGLVDSLEVARQAWQTEMINACDKLQQLEEERIEFLRKELWAVINTDSQSCVHRDEENERVRNTLEQVNVEHDIREFLRVRQTGNVPPEKILYEKYETACDGLSRPPLPRPDRSPVGTGAVFHRQRTKPTVDDDDDAGYTSVNF